MVAFAVCIWVIAAAGQETVYWGFLLLMAGLPVYVLMARRREALATLARPDVASHAPDGRTECDS